MKDLYAITALITRGAAVVRTVLLRPKNLAKDDFSENIEELFLQAEIEMLELKAEIIKKDWEKAIFEGGDACAFIFAIIQKSMERSGMDVCMYESRVCLGAEPCGDAVCACYDRERAK